ncbi:alpha/beta hydrolase [Rhodococcus kronopolitis]|uniref:Alpha/beta hydrolase n=1 Tax=Rhodococcus kronopolitis TaxID=1460226 RepID=A0ABV9FPG8_9NOCA
MTSTTEPVADRDRGTPAERPLHPWRRRVAWAAGSVLVLTALLVATVLIVINVTPRPGALVIRALFDRGADSVTAQLEQGAPTTVDRIADQQYRPGDSDALLDVYVPQAAVADNAALPTVVWTHGGAWVSGSKDHYAGYYQRLADRGFTVVSLGYSLGPEHTYPTPVHQLNDAHAYLLANAERLHVDPNRIALAGDSAGAQLSSQLAALVTSPDYARELGVTPALSPAQLRAVVLNCGIYEVPAMTGTGGLVGWGADTSMWAYTGEKDVQNSVPVRQMSTLRHVTAAYPPTYVSGGNGDPLTETQSKPLAGKLTGLGVRTDTLFFPTDLEPALPHEYQFDLGREESRLAFERTVDFLEAHTAP